MDEPRLRQAVEGEGSVELGEDEMGHVGRLVDRKLANIANVQKVEGERRR